MVIRIIDILKEQPDISQNALGESLGVTRRVVQKYTNALKEAGSMLMIKRRLKRKIKRRLKRKIKRRKAR